jgi:predicted dehydrogenase
VIEDAQVDLIYIASNHASHAPYAVAALKRGKSAYVEKPIAVSIDQLAALVAAANTSSGRLFVGYNRPFSKAVRRLRECSLDTAGAMTLACFISGHQLPLDSRNKCNTLDWVLLWEPVIHT